MWTRLNTQLWITCCCRFLSKNRMRSVLELLQNITDMITKTSAIFDKSEVNGFLFIDICLLFGISLQLKWFLLKLVNSCRIVVNYVGCKVSYLTCRHVIFISAIFISVHIVHLLTQQCLHCSSMFFGICVMFWLFIASHLFKPLGRVGFAV